MPAPKKHHFLPEFYLERWTSGADRALVEFTRPYLQASWKYRSPGGTGYEPHLYAIPTREDADARQEIESKVMSPLDFAASKALDAFEDRGEISSGAPRVAWARFIISLMYRSPRRVELLRKRVRTLESVELEADYARVRGDHDPPTVLAFLQQADESFHAESVALLISKLLHESRTTVDFICGMKWQYVRLANQPHSLLTCDEPIIKSEGVGHPGGFILLPTGPASVFLAANTQATMDGFNPLLRSAKAAATLNHIVCTNAWSLVIGDSPKHLRFVERRLRLKDEEDGGKIDRNTWLAPTG